MLHITYTCYSATPYRHLLFYKSIIIINHILLFPEFFPVELADGFPLESSQVSSSFHFQLVLPSLSCFIDFPVP